MNKSRMTPFFALTPSPSLKVEENDSLETHLLELVALEALTSTVAEKEEVNSTTWSTSVAKRLDGGALSFAAFRGKIEANPETGRPEPQLSAERKLSIADYRALGLFDELGRGAEAWQDDDVALGINFSRLHRIARLIENRAPDFMQGLQARIQEDMRANATYEEFENAAERRRKRAEEDHAREQEQWRIEQEARELEWQKQKEQDRSEALAFKRRVAEMFGQSFEDDDQLDFTVQTFVNTTTKGYEKDFGRPMPEEYAKHAPYTWARVGGPGNPRIFFDARGERIPEPA